MARFRLVPAHIDTDLGNAGPSSLRLTPRSKSMASQPCISAMATDRWGRAARNGTSPLIVAQSDPTGQPAAPYRTAYCPALLRNAMVSWMMILRPSMLIEPRAASVCRTRFTAGRDAPTICASSVWVRPRSTGTP